MTKAQVRPLFSLPGDALVALIERGDQSAIDEGAFRSSKTVRHALAGIDQAPARKPRTRSAKSARVQVAQARAPKAAPVQAPKVRKPADPVKQLRAQVASLLEPAKGTSGWWDAYKATRGMTQAELEASLAQFATANA